MFYSLLNQNKSYTALLVPSACVFSALLLRSLIVDAENEENNENKIEKFRKKENDVSGEKKFPGWLLISENSLIFTNWLNFQLVKKPRENYIVHRTYG